MRQLWTDPKFLDAIRNGHAKGDVPISPGPRPHGPGLHLAGGKPLGGGAMGAAGKATAGAAAKQGKGGRVKKIDFSDEGHDVVKVAQEKGKPGRSGEVMITEEFTLLQTYIGVYWRQFSLGIENFATAMTLASEAEVETQMLKATFTAVGKAALDYALGQLADKLKSSVLGAHWGLVISLAKGAVEAWVAESERAAGAAGQVILKDYLISLRNSIKPAEDAMRKAVEDGEPKFIEEYRRLAKGDFAKGKPTDDGRVIGEAATVLTQVKEAVAAFNSAIPLADTFRARFTRNFAYTPGAQRTGGGGSVETGVLQFEIHLYRDGEGKEFSVDEGNSWEAWTLYTKNPNPERIAESLVKTLQGKKPWQLDLTKKVKITVETEEFAINDYKTIRIAFENDPNSYRLNVGNADLAKKAWKYAQTHVLAATKIDGSNG
jgi:hypothetical protein